MGAVLKQHTKISRRGLGRLSVRPILTSGTSSRPPNKGAVPKQRTAFARRGLGRLSARPILTSGTTLVAVAMSLLLAPATDANAAPASMAGWTRDFVDDFNSLNTKVWGPYESSNNGGGLLSEYDAANVFVSGGSLNLKTYKAGTNDWRSAGVSGAKGFSAAKGKWVLRAKFDRAYGIGYAFLLMPKGGGWPPEIDIAEGTAGGPRVMSTLHWSSSNFTDSRSNYNVDMTQWHTYGVVITDNKAQFTVDGAVWTTINNSNVPRGQMWIGFQAGAKAPISTATGEVVGSKTPQSSKIYIDWVAHYRAS